MKRRVVCDVSGAVCDGWRQPAQNSDALGRRNTLAVCLAAETVHGMGIQLAPPHEDLTFMAPLSERRADVLSAFLASGDHLSAADERSYSVVDAGCGWGELLLRTLEADPAARGLGLDLDEGAIAHGRKLARARGLHDRVDLRVADVRTELPAEAAHAICVGASHIWSQTSSSPQPLDYRSALRALRQLLPPGGRLVYGEAIWSAPPTEAAMAALSGIAEEFQTLAAVLEVAAEEGFSPVHVFEATLGEWDEFESGFAACYARWLSDHPATHPDSPEVREMAARQRRAYFEGYRGVMGMGYFGLIAV